MISRAVSTRVDLNWSSRWLRAIVRLPKAIVYIFVLDTMKENEHRITAKVQARSTFHRGHRGVWDFPNVVSFSVELVVLMIMGMVAMRGTKSHRMRCGD